MPDRHHLRVPHIARTAALLGLTALAAPVATGVAPPGGAIPNDTRAIAHVLNRLGFGPGPGDIARIRRSGLALYIERQLRPEEIDDHEVTARLAGFETLELDTRELAARYFLPALREREARQRRGSPAGERNDQSREPGPEPSTADTSGPAQRDMPRPAMIETVRLERIVLEEMSSQKLIRAVYSERQLQEVLVDFWFNHFNVFAGKGPTRQYLTAYERDAIRPHALGRFRDLLGSVAESPAMLFYLDNWMSADPEGPDPRRTARLRDVDGQRPRGRARRGDFNGRRPPQLLNPPEAGRSPGLNENYARELMELHTLGVDGGYTQDDVVEVARAFTGWTIDRPRQGGDFRFEPAIHVSGPKVVLGEGIDAGDKRDGERVLDLLARHPATARLIATKLVRRFVADDPPAALVERAAGRFLETGGAIREVVRTIVTSPEFFAPEAYRAKVKTPFEFVVSAIRATGTALEDATPLVRTLRELGMPLYFAQPPTGYPDRAEAWVNTGTLLARMNFAIAFAGGRLHGVAMPPAVRDGDGNVITPERIVREILDGDVADGTRATLERTREPQVRLALAIGSPEFQRR